MADFLHRNPRLLFLLLAVIVVAGSSAFLVLPRLEDPILGRRVGVISTVFPGANAERVEALVTIPLEERLTGIADIQQVRSNSQNSISNIVVELSDFVTDIDSVWSLVRTSVADSAERLPETCSTPELQVVPLKAFAAIIAVQPATDLADPQLLITRQRTGRLKNALAAISGTEHVTVFGDPGGEFLIALEPTALAATGLSTAAIAAQIADSQTIRPAGRLPQDTGNLALDLQDAEAPIEKLQQTLIRVPATGATTRLSDIATISKQRITPAATAAIINERPAIVLGVMVADDLRVDQWSDRMQATLAEFQTQFAGDVSANLLFSQRDHVDLRMQMLLQNLAIGVAAVTLVVLIMMGWRSMIVVALALPLSAFLVLAAMRLLEIPVHQMSATGLIVALGLLIDNAIVMVEEVRSRILQGVSRSQAVIEGVAHLTMPLCGSTLTTALAFLPIATLPGPPGEFVGTIAISVILAICASLALALTIIPALVGLLKIDQTHTGWLSRGLSAGRFAELYQLSLRAVFRAPVLGLGLGLLLPLTGFFLASKLPEQFFPPSDRDQLQIEVELPAYADLAETEAAVAQIQAVVAEFPQVRQQHWFLGNSAPTFFYNVVPRRRGTPFYAQAFVDLQQQQDTGSVVRGLQEELDRQILQGRVLVRQLEQGPPIDAPVELRILGNDMATLQRLGSELRLMLSQTSHVIHTRSDVEETIPRMRLTLDETATAKAGTNSSELAGLLYTTLEGASAGTMFDDGLEYPVKVRLNLNGSLRMERLAALPLPALRRPQPNAAPINSTTTASAGLNPLTLSSIAQWKLDSTAGAVVRINGRRANEVKAWLQAEVLPSRVITEFKRRLADSNFQLPAGYQLEFGGETEQRSQAVDRLIANGFVLFALMLLTLVTAFRSFRCAMIIACVGGLSAGLGPLALACFGYPLGFMAIIGTMGLVGVAINDSIVVLAAIKANPLANVGNRHEIVAEVSHCTRHILATTFTTLVGFLPLILDGGRFWPPLAVTIAGGVSGATFLALYFTPSLYLLVCGRRSLADEAHSP